MEEGKVNDFKVGHTRIRAPNGAGVAKLLICKTLHEVDGVKKVFVICCSTLLALNIDIYIKREHE